MSLLQYKLITKNQPPFWWCRRGGQVDFCRGGLGTLLLSFNQVLKSLSNFLQHWQSTGNKIILLEEPLQP
jgi:hypothetical protein